MPSNTFTGFMSGANQFGRWVPEKQIHARAFMGGSTIDFSHALFTEAVITIHCKSLCGGVTIIVPPNVVVEQNGRAIMGGFGGSGGLYYRARSSQISTSGSSTGLIVKISGTSVMGGISAIVNKKAAPAQLITPAEAERIVREVPDVSSSTRLDVVQQVLGEVFGGFAATAERVANDASATLQRATSEDPSEQRGQHDLSVSEKDTRVVQGVPMDGQHLPVLLSSRRFDNAQTNGLKAPLASAPPVPPQDWKQELKELKALMDEGILTQDEFDDQKKRILMQAQ